MSAAVLLATNYVELADVALLPFYCQNTYNSTIFVLYFLFFHMLSCNYLSLLLMLCCCVMSLFVLISSSFMILVLSGIVGVAFPDTGFIRVVYNIKKTLKKGN
jgi:hypothetical protein